MKTKDMHTGLQRVKPFVSSRGGITDSIRKSVLLGYTGTSVTLTSNGEYGRLKTHVPVSAQGSFDPVAVPWDALSKTVKALMDGGNDSMTIKAQDRYASPWENMLPEVEHGNMNTSACIRWLENNNPESSVLARYDAMLAQARRVVRANNETPAPTTDLSWESCESICLYNKINLPDGFTDLEYEIRDAVINAMQSAEPVRRPATRMTIEVADAVINLETEPATDFPESRLTTDKQDDTKVYIGRFHVYSIDDIRSRLLPHVLTDPSRPTLTGISWNPKDDHHIEIVATNGFHLGVLSIAHMPATFPAPAFIIPGGTIKRIQTNGAGGLAPNKHEMFDLVYYPQANVAVMTFESGTRLEIPCIDGTFPNYKHIIPTSHAGTIRVKTTDMIAGLKLVERFIGNDQVVQLSPDPDANILAMASQDTSGSAVKQFQARLEAHEPAYTWPTISLGYGKLKAVVEAVARQSRHRRAEEIDIMCNDQVSPLVLRAVGDDNYFAILMPMSLGDD